MSALTNFAYDAKGNLTKAAPPPPQGATTYRYDSLGRPTEVVDGRGTTTYHTYDDRDRVVQVDTSAYDVVTYTYDADGNLSTRTDATTWRYDALSWEKVRTLPDGSITILAYTADGSVDTYTDPAGTVDYTWDDAGRLTELTDPAGPLSPATSAAPAARTTSPARTFPTLHKAARSCSSRAADSIRAIPPGSTGHRAPIEELPAPGAVFGRLLATPCPGRIGAPPGEVRCAYRVGAAREGSTR